MLRLPALPLAAALLLVGPAAHATVRTHHRSSSHAMVRRNASTRVVHMNRVVEHAAPAGMSAERATQIQTALIQKGYLTGEASGTWDASSVAAMQKLQSDNGWQTRLVPDSRALIKLGLGAGSQPAPTTGTTAVSTNATSATSQATSLDQTF